MIRVALRFRDAKTELSLHRGMLDSQLTKKKSEVVCPFLDDLAYA
jgi:hypothetical protein